jgi:hypothetical protein
VVGSYRSTDRWPTFFSSQHSVIPCFDQVTRVHTCCVVTSCYEVRRRGKPVREGEKRSFLFNELSDRAWPRLRHPALALWPPSLCDWPSLTHPSVYESPGSKSLSRRPPSRRRRPPTRRLQSRERRRQSVERKRCVGTATTRRTKHSTRIITTTYTRRRRTVPVGTDLDGPMHPDSALTRASLARSFVRSFARPQGLQGERLHVAKRQRNL